MASLVMFLGSPKVTAAANVKRFIAEVRERHTAFGADLDFDADDWDVTPFVSTRGREFKTSLRFRKRKTKCKRGMRPRVMREPFRSFAKAFVRYHFGLRPWKGPTEWMGALRLLEEALARNGRAGVHQATVETFDRAAAVARKNYEGTTAYRAGARLAELARFLDEHFLVERTLQWRHPFKRPEKYTSRIGERFERRREAKLPSQADLDALAEAFKHATEVQDRIITSGAAVMLGNPCRISELLTLPVECEITAPLRQGGSSYGLRWWPAKGAAPQVKWIPAAMIDVVRRAVKTIRELTEPARRIADWYERSPSTLYLPERLAGLREKRYLTHEEVGQLIGGSDGKEFCYRHRLKPGPAGRRVTVAFKDVERALLSYLPRGFPVLDAETGLRFSQALFIVRRSEFRSYSAGLYECMCQRVSPQAFNAVLGAAAKFGHSSVFSRLGLNRPDGSPIRFTSHQFRHYVDTLAQKGGMEQLHIAKWSGRSEVAQNAQYDHESGPELLARLHGALGDDARWKGPLAEQSRRSPVSRAEFSRLAIPTAHTTDLGICIHDFTMSPCQLHLDCLRCTELVCIKGHAGKTEAIRRRLVEARQLLNSAASAMSKEEYGADRWVAHHAETVQRLEALVSILDDPRVATGTAVQVGGGSGAPSRIRSAAERAGLLAPGPSAAAVFGNERPQLKGRSDLES